jgi:hypothetical protein
MLYGLVQQQVVPPHQVQIGFMGPAALLELLHCPRTAHVDHVVVLRLVSLNLNRAVRRRLFSSQVG